MQGPLFGGHLFDLIILFDFSYLAQAYYDITTYRFMEFKFQLFVTLLLISVIASQIIQ